MRRALSWLERAEKEADDDDAAFTFYWIAFNAAYARDRSNDLEMRERHRFGDFIDALYALDSDHTIHKAIRDRFTESVRALLEEQVRLPANSGTTFRAAATANWEQRFMQGGANNSQSPRSWGHQVGP